MAAALENTSLLDTRDCAENRAHVHTPSGSSSVLDWVNDFLSHKCDTEGKPAFSQA